MTILYAEDNVITARCLKQALEQAGNYEVVVATNGMEAWQYFSNKFFDVCLLDVHMPELDGVELGAKIRGVNTIVPIVYISADAHRDTQLKGFNVGGADDYCVKPIDVPVLIPKMEALCRRAKEQLEACETIVLDSYIINTRLATLTVDDMSISITANEIRVLKYLLANVNKTVENDVLKLLVSGVDKQRTLYTTISMLRTHFKYSRNVEIFTIQCSGYLLSVPKDIIRYF